ncbi:MAG: hypothetical protein AAFR47_01425 [Pseudomonadota bacterium]
MKPTTADILDALTLAAADLVFLPIAVLMGIAEANRRMREQHRVHRQD